MLVCNIGFAADDPLSDVLRPQVEGMFGAGSTVAYCIYIAEVILGTVVYVKSKNLLSLLGVPIIVVTTHAMFKYIGTQS